MANKMSFPHPRLALALASLLAIADPTAGWAAGNHSGSHAESSAIGELGVRDKVSRTITVIMGDSYFEPKIIKTKPGETVRFIVKNTGELLHEFNIGTPQMHAVHQKEMAQMLEQGLLAPTGTNHDMAHMSHATMGTMPMMKHDDPNSILVEPGQTRELIWKVGSAKDLEFACNVPGHYQSGMVGRIKTGQ